MNLNQVEQSYAEYTQAFEAGVISKEEYKCCRLKDKE